MTRDEVINAFPPAGHDMNAWILLGAIAAIVFVIMFFLWSTDVFQYTKVGTALAIVVMSVTLLFDIAVVLPKLWEENRYEKELPEIRETWVKEMFNPYVESLEKVKISILQSKWNEEGAIDVLLDTNKYKKNLNGITDFQYYESTDPNDEGYIYIKDLGNIEDFPKDFSIKMSYGSTLIDSVHIPKKKILTR
ncbi:hypothetical protein [Paenibacillus amylolyticus]|uniref:Uncharacterized protein n=1 Tax=Paenibacillus amylolyticus TaxID=1451 RepID=A0ABD8B2N7_PAEAM